MAKAKGLRKNHGCQIKLGPIKKHWLCRTSTIGFKKTSKGLWPNCVIDICFGEKKSVFTFFFNFVRNKYLIMRPLLVKISTNMPNVYKNWVLNDFKRTLAYLWIREWASGHFFALADECWQWVVCAKMRNSMTGWVQIFFPSHNERKRVRKTTSCLIFHAEIQDFLKPLAGWMICMASTS